MHARRRGFTLIEVIVVTVIAASLATVLIIRLGGTRDRSFNLLRDRVGDLLLTYALRAEFADAPIGIGLEPDRRRLLLVRRYLGSMKLMRGKQPRKGLRASPVLPIAVLAPWVRC